jgi:hypothetical protein
MLHKERLISAAWAIVFLAVIFFLPTRTAHAYLDPGSGSLLLQILVAGAVGALLTFRVWWKRLAGLITGKQDSEDVDESPGTGVD